MGLLGLAPVIQAVAMGHPEAIGVAILCVPHLVIPGALAFATAVWSGRFPSWRGAAGA